jgi:hypothetical protein
LKDNLLTSATPVDHIIWPTKYGKNSKKTICKRVGTETQISTQTINTQTEEPNTQSNHMNKVYSNNIEAQSITGNKKEVYKSKIFPSDVKARTRLAHIALKISSTTHKKINIIA